MNNKDLVKLLVLNAIGITIAIVLLSPGLLGKVILVSAGSFLTALKISVGLLFVLVWLYGNKVILTNMMNKDTEDEVASIDKYDDISSIEELSTNLIEAIDAKGDIDIIGKRLRVLSMQTEQVKRKYNIAKVVVGQLFKEGSLSAQKFVSALAQLESTFVTNSTKAMFSLNIFDSTDYGSLVSLKRNGYNVEDRIRPHDDLLNGIDSRIETNKKILEAFDWFIVEANKMDSGASEDNEEQIKEVNGLVTQLKEFYK